MKKQSLFILLLCGLIAGVILLFVRTQNRQEQDSSKPIRIGAIYQQTGSGAAYGNLAIRGITLAMDEINGNNGVNGRKLEIVSEDSKSDPKAAVAAMQKFVEIDRIKFIFSQQSSIVLALSPIANNQKVILVDTGATTPLYTSPDDFTFRTSYSADYFARVIAEELNKRDVKKLGLLYMNDEYGKGMAAKYKEYFSGSIVTEETFLQKDTDFRTQLLKVKTAQPEAIAFVSLAEEAGRLLKQKDELGISIPFYSDVYSVEYESILKNAGKGAEGIIYVAPLYDLQRNHSVFIKFDTTYRKKYGEASVALVAQAYDGLMILARAVNQCKDAEDTVCVKEKLYKTKEVPGVIGQITFNRNGEIEYRPVILKKVKDGKFEKISE